MTVGEDRPRGRPEQDAVAGVVGSEGCSQVLDSELSTLVVKAGKHPAEQAEHELLGIVDIVAEPDRVAPRFELDVGEAGGAEDGPDSLGVGK